MIVDEAGAITLANSQVERIFDYPNGSTGTFGFLHLAGVARRFERAAESGTTETAILAAQLTGAAEATVAIMRQELAGAAAVET